MGPTENIDCKINRLKRTMSREGVSRSVARHSFARSRSQLRRWKDALAEARRKKIKKVRQMRYEQIGRQ